MTKTSGARYTLRFKHEAGCPVGHIQGLAAAARALGLVEQTLFNWVMAHKQSKLKGVEAEPVSAVQMVIGLLRAQLEHVWTARVLLGKATAYFAQGSICSLPSFSICMLSRYRYVARCFRLVRPATKLSWCAVPAMCSGRV